MKNLLSFFKRYTYFWIGIIIFVFLFSSCPQISLAKNKSLESKIKKKVYQIKQKREKLYYQRRRLRILNIRERDIAQQLAQTQLQLKQARDSLDNVYLKLIKNQNQLRAIKKTLNKIQENLKNHSKNLSFRLRDIYENSQINYLSALIQADDFCDFLNRLDFLKSIVDSDFKLLANIKQEERKYFIAKAKYEEKIQENIALRKKLKEKETVLVSLESKRRSLLRQVSQQRRSLSGYIVELEHSTRQLENQLQNLIRQRQQANIRSKATSPYGGSGRFYWPCKSRYITSPFGWRTHPIYGRVKFHTGIDIAASYGSPIYAADSGVVIYSGWYGGYGKTVIIDHGGGYSTLYGHCSALYVRKGQRVSQRQKIAAIGSTGISTGPHLHFEVRQNGTPVNPRSKL